MSFWSDASPVVKGVIVVGAVGLLYFLVAYFAHLPPYSVTEEATTGERGLPPPS